MSKKNDDSIEKFFRKAVNQYDASFRESDWKAMEKMLDEQEATRPGVAGRNVKRAAIALAGALILSVGVYFITLYDSDDSAEDVPQKTQVVAGKESPQTETNKSAANLLSSEAHSALADEASKANDKISGEQTPTTADTTTEADKNSSHTADISGAVRKGLKTEQGTQIETQKAEGTEQNFVDRGQSTQVGNNPVDTREALVVTDKQPERKQLSANDKLMTEAAAQEQERLDGKDGSTSSLVSGTLPIEADQKDYQTASLTQPQQAEGTVDAKHQDPSKLRAPVTDLEKDTKLIPAQETPAGLVSKNEKPPAINEENKNTLTPGSELATVPVKDTLSQPVKTEEKIRTTSEESNAGQEKHKKNSSRWSIFLSLAPDFSSTRFGRMSSPGGAYGFQVGYRVLPSVSIQTGLIRSSKRYVGYGDEYSPPEGYWGSRTNGVIPDKIDGQCAIVEMPILVQVDVKQSNRSRIFISGGSSSYLMLSESYDYTFNADNPGAAEGWWSTKSSTYPFAVGHLSAGYERNLTPRLGLGIEPFVKIPFAKVGWPNINLFTTGFYLNVRYRFFKRERGIVPDEKNKTTQ